MPCREHLSQLRRHEHQLADGDVDVAIVTFEADFLARAYIEDTRLPWPVLIDRDRTLYHAHGMDSASGRDLWNLSTLVAYARGMLRGHGLRKSEADVHQRGGDVLVDPDGIVRLHHVGRGPADRPAVDEILDRVRT